MPLVKPDYYTLQEALELIKGALPDEDALENLREALHDRSGAAWIIDGAGRRVPIPSNLWLSSLDLTLSVERGTAKFKELGGLGAWRFPAVEGPIRIDRAQLDALCTNEDHSTRVNPAGEMSAEAPALEARSSLADPYKTALPGKPSIRHLILAEFRRRVAEKDNETSLSKEAQALCNWARTKHPEAPTTTARTVENHIRSEFRQLVKNASTKFPTK